MKLVVEVFNQEFTERCFGTCTFYQAPGPTDRWCRLFNKPLRWCEKGNLLRCAECRKAEWIYLDAKWGE